MGHDVQDVLTRLRHCRGFAIDLDGTIYLGSRLLPGARPFIDTLKKAGIPFVFLTNNSSRSAADYLTKLRGLGLEVEQHHILTSGQATIDYLARHCPGAKVYLLGTEALREEFRQAGIVFSDAETCEVAVLGFDTSVTYARLQDFCMAVRRGTRYLATHPDVLCPTEGEPLIDVGAFIELVRAATGRSPDVVVGKPNSLMVTAICQRLGAPPEDICVVGDRLYTDMAMALRHGMTGLLVLTGETTLELLQKASCQPDIVVDDLERLADLLARLHLDQ